MELNIKRGVYLVIDPKTEQNKLFSQLKKIKGSPLSALQIWENFDRMSKQEIRDTLQFVFDLFNDENVPILINNRWEYLLDFPFTGVHFDVFPNTIKEISKRIGRPFLKGLTLNNDLSLVPDAEKEGFNYLSFCSLFPSSTSNSCEIVRFDTVKRCREITEMPIFIAGGITPQKMALVDELDYHGVAVVSGIMDAENPVEQLDKYLKRKMY